MIVARDRPAADRIPVGDGRLLRRRLLLLAGVFALCGAVALAVDLPAARWFRAKPLPKELMQLFDFAEIFAHGIGVASVLAALLVIDPSLRLRSARLQGFFTHDFVRLVAATVTGGLFVDVLKVSVIRLRPRAVDLDAVTSAFGTFGRHAVETVGVATAHGKDLMSFPSGHSAVAAGLAAGLAWRYPHAWPAFVVFAALAVAQRLSSCAHYPSDTACGVALGLLGAAIWLGGSPRHMHEPHPAASPAEASSGAATRSSLL